MIIRKDLLKTETSLSRILLGIIFFIISIAWIFNKTIDGESISTFDWLYSVFFAVNGIVFILDGIGLPTTKLFGRAFVLIDSDTIAIKSSIFAKEKKLSWHAIETIGYRSNNLIFTKENKETIAIDLSKMDYSLVQSIKESIKSYAEIKEITIKR